MGETMDGWVVFYLIGAAIWAYLFIRYTREHAPRWLVLLLMIYMTFSMLERASEHLPAEQSTGAQP